MNLSRNRNQPTKPINFRNVPRRRMTKETTAQSSKGIIFISIDHGGTTTLINTISNGYCNPLNDTSAKAVGKGIITYAPYLYVEQELEVSSTFSLIDVGLLTNDKMNDFKIALGSLLTINCVVICLKIGRWTKMVKNDLTKTVSNLNLLNLNQRSNILICLTHSDVYNQQTIERFFIKVREYLSTSGLFSDNILTGSFLREQDLSELGRSCLSEEIKTSVDNFYVKINDFGPMVNVRVDSRPIKYNKSELKKIQKIEEFKHRVPEPPVVKQRKNNRNINNELERRILMFGQSGSGKSSIINLLIENATKYETVKQESNLNLESVTKKCIRTTVFGIKDIDSEGNESKDITRHSCQLVDTVGFGDIDHSTYEVKRELLYEMYNHLSYIDLIIFCMNLNTRNKTTLDELETILEWITKILDLTPECFLFIFTHSDFYSNEFRLDCYNRVKKYKTFAKLMNDDNIEFACCPNLDEVHPRFKDYFKIMKANLKVRLLDEITVDRPRINARLKVEGPYKSYIGEINEQEVKDLESILEYESE